MATDSKDHGEQSPPSSSNADQVPEGARLCPICQQPMQTTSRGEEAIDVCEPHGVWLDRDELERMLFARTHRRGIGTRNMAEDSRRKGFLEGLFWGILI